MNIKSRLPAQEAGFVCSHERRIVVPKVVTRSVPDQTTMMSFLI